MNNSKYCLFFDWDNTLSVNGKVSQANLDALKKVQADGHYIVLNTGRAKGIIPKDAYAINWDGIIASAAYIEFHNEVLSSHYISRESLEQAKEYCDKYDLRLIIEGQEYGYSYGKSSIFPDLKYCWDTFLFRYFDKIKPCKFTFDKDLTNYKDAKFDGVWLICHKGYSEVLPIGFDKSTGIKMICDKLGLPIENTISFGDSLNDLDMLKFTGKSVIVKSAIKELDKYATIRTTTDEEGVAEAINQLLYSK